MAGARGADPVAPVTLGKRKTRLDGAFPDLSATESVQQGAAEARAQAPGSGGQRPQNCAHRRPEGPSRALDPRLPGAPRETGDQKRGTGAPPCLALAHLFSSCSGSLSAPPSPPHSGLWTVNEPLSLDSDLQGLELSQKRLCDPRAWHQGKAAGTWARRATPLQDTPAAVRTPASSWAQPQGYRDGGSPSTSQGGPRGPKASLTLPSNKLSFRVYLVPRTQRKRPGDRWPPRFLEQSPLPALSMS